MGEATTECFDCLVKVNIEEASRIASNSASSTGGVFFMTGLTLASFKIMSSAPLAMNNAQSEGVEVMPAWPQAVRSKGVEAGAACRAHLHQLRHARIRGLSRVHYGSHGSANTSAT